MSTPEVFSPPCRKCCGPNGIHYLTCLTLRIRAGLAKFDEMVDGLDVYGPGSRVSQHERGDGDGE